MSQLPLTQLKQQKLAVLYGGTSAEREISLKSGEAVFNGLKTAGFNAKLIDTAEKPLSYLTDNQFQRAFIVLHGRGGEDGTIQGALDYLAIPYTGSGVLGSAIAMDKLKTKQIWQAMQLPTAAYKVIEKAHYKASNNTTLLASLGGKVMVKPIHEGSSIGMAIADSVTTLADAIELAFQYDNVVMLEQYITGPEFTVAILGEQALPSICMATPNAFYDYQAKYQSQTTEYKCPSGLSEQDESELQAIALKAFKAVSASGWGRVDVMRDCHGQFQLLEVNTVPGMTKTSLVPKAAAVAGYSFETLVSKIVELSAT